MKLVYVAGPFRASTQWEMAENIRAAERVGLMVALAGAMPVIPHANTAHFHGINPDRFWLEGTLALLEVCHGAVFIPGWKTSKGSVGEWGAAARLSMPALDMESIPRDAQHTRIIQFVSRLYAEEDNTEAQRDTPQATGN